MRTPKKDQRKKAFILGGSSGFGLASAHKLARHGYDLFIVHRDRKFRMEVVEKEFEAMRSLGAEVASININVNDPAAKEPVGAELKRFLGKKGKVHLLLHSVADGNIGSLIGPIEPGNPFGRPLSDDAFAYTIHSMGTSFFSWSRMLLNEKMFSADARIIGITSEGTSHILNNYSAVASAKAVLEQLCKYMAVEFAPEDIRVNLINAGVTDTQAIKIFPDYKELIENSIKRNPFKRITTPTDIANVVYLLSTEEASWINGTVIRADGGEQLL